MTLLFQLAAEFTKPGREGEQLHALLEARAESTENWVRVRNMPSFNKQQTTVVATGTGAVVAAHQYKMTVTVLFLLRFTLHFKFNSFLPSIIHTNQYYNHYSTTKTNISYNNAITYNNAY